MYVLDYDLKKKFNIIFIGKRECKCDDGGYDSHYLLIKRMIKMTCSYWRSFLKSCACINK